MKLTPQQRSLLGEWLGRYVYILADPANGVPFYVGRGREARVTAHGIEADKWVKADEPSENRQAKLDKIEEIRSRAGNPEPEVFIARRKIGSDAECAAVEAVLIDAFLAYEVTATLNVPPVVGTRLTNKVRGAGAANGLERLESLVTDATAPPLTTKTALLVISLRSWVDEKERLPGGGHRAGRGWKPEWASEAKIDFGELGDVVRCWWYQLREPNTDAKNVHHVVATYRSVSRALFAIVPGSWEYAKVEGKSRGGFAVEPITSGPLWDEVVGDKGRRLPDKQRGDASAYRYWPYD